MRRAIRDRHIYLPIPVVIFVSITVLTGIATTSVHAAPLLVLCVLATGIFFLSGVDLSPVERLVLVPAVGFASLAVSSLIIPLSSTLGLVERPVHSSAVLAVAAASPTILSALYWSRRRDPALPSITMNPRLFVAAIPVVLGGGGALIQWKYGVVSQNYAVMAALVLLVPALLYWARTELEVALSLYGLAVGVLLSHTLVTGYAIGSDVQVSIYSIERITATGAWPIGDFFFEAGAADAPIHELIYYIATDMKHTMLPVIVGVPVLFKTVGNTTADMVFNVVYAGLFGLTPVGIYVLARERLSVRNAFVAGMLFVVYFRFFHTSPAKQHLAQFFMIALLVVWHSKAEGTPDRFLSVLMVVAVIFSHYAVTFLFFGALLGAYLLSALLVRSDRSSHVTLIFLGHFYALIGLWYVVVAGGKHPIRAFSAIASSIVSLMSTGTTPSRTGAGYVATKVLLVDRVNLGLHAVLFGFITLGVIYVLYHLITTRRPFFSPELDALSFYFWGLIAVSMVMTGHLGVDRTMDIGLTILAPAGVYGLAWCLDTAQGRLRVPRIASYTHHFGIVFVALLLLFSSGLAYEAAGHPATSAINLHENPNSVMYTEAELEAAEWTVDAANNSNSTIYASTFSTAVFRRIMSDRVRGRVVTDYKDYKLDIVIDWNEPGYIYVRRSAITTEPYRKTPGHLFQRETVESFLQKSDVVYSNHDVVVLEIDYRNNTVTNETAGTG